MRHQDIMIIVQIFTVSRGVRDEPVNSGFLYLASRSGKRHSMVLRKAYFDILKRL